MLVLLYIIYIKAIDLNMEFAYESQRGVDLGLLHDKFYYFGKCLKQNMLRMVYRQIL